MAGLKSREIIYTYQVIGLRFPWRIFRTGKSKTSCRTYGTNIEGDLIADGKYLYNGNLYYDEGKVTNKVIVFDISNPASPSIAYKGDLGLGAGSFTSAKYMTNYLLAGGQNGLFIIDISNRSNLW